MVVLCLLFLLPKNLKAGICFLPDCEEKIKVEADNSGAEKCHADGYESEKNLSCGRYSVVEYCPENSSYIKCNDAEWCRINDYVLTECVSPEKLVDKCLNGLEMYKECQLDQEEACKLENPDYVSTCYAGWALDPDKLCSLSDNWGLCCNTCPGYEYSDATLPEDAIPVASCESCWGKRYIIADNGFNQCQGFWDCQDGCEIGSETCISGGITKCKTCKRCEANCSLVECPAGAVCDYEACTQRYCAVGCGTDLTYYCEAPITDCDILGYDKSIEDCEGSGIISCPSDNKKVICLPDDGTCCNRCADYDYDSAPEGYVISETCVCCGKQKHKVIPNPCSGFKKCPYGPATDSNSCLSGTETMYVQCKECPNACEGNTTCPKGAICQKDACSNTYCPTGCEVNYDNYCNNPITNCRDLGYETLSSACSSGGYIRCPFDDDWVLCMDDENRETCGAYTYLTIPAGYVEDGSCTYQGVTKYKIKADPCVGFEDCKSGPDSGAKSCLSGATTMYDKCKNCPNAFDYKSCPMGYICETDSCSNTFNPIGCATNYDNYCGVVTTKCGDLGYQPYDASCAGKDMLYCPYDSNWVLCTDKNTCEGYDYTSVPAGYVELGRCTYQGTTKYQIEPAKCEGYVELSACPSGAADGAKTCLSGTITKYSACKDCPDATEYTSCPQGYVCSQDACSKTYTPTGCANNYANYCYAPITNCRELGYEQYSSDCVDGAVAYCPYDRGWVICLNDGNRDSCGAYTHLSVPAGYIEDGSCTYQGVTKYKIKANPCDGFEDCKSGPDSGAKSCLSGATTMYDKCKNCPNAFDYKSCPTGYICETDSCSNTYNPIGCASGNQNYCGSTVTDCGKLGYQRYDSNCAGKDMIYCPYDSNWVLCTDRNTCEGYEHTSVPAGYVADGLCVYNGTNKYKIKPAECSGFVPLTSCQFGAADGAKTCLSGSTTKYSACKECPDATEYSACPQGYVCSKDSCSNTYIPTGCGNNYANFCTAPITSCPELGYESFANECIGAAVVYCPYDNNWVICTDKPNCEGYGYLETEIPEGYVSAGACTIDGVTLHKIKIKET